MSTENKEIEALSKVVEALDSLDDDEVFRVVEYVMKKYIHKMKDHKKAELKAYNNLITKLENELEEDAREEIDLEDSKQS